LGGDMGSPEISLGTTNASNLYVVDYYGGSGGEFLGELVSDAVKCIHTRKKLPNDSTSIDSFRNFLVQPYVNNEISKILYKGKCTTDTFAGEILLRNMLIMHYWQKNSIEPKDTPIHLAIKNTINDNVLLRNHLPERDWSSLPNRKHIYIYPNSDDYHITLPLMFVKQWMIIRNNEYNWEWANRELNLGCKTFNDFVDMFFENTKKTKTTDSVDTSYSINISPKSYAYGIDDWSADLENYIGAKIGSAAKWQKNNIKILKDLNLSLNSTEQECIDRIKDVYSRNSKR
jgi:hypothetical protein